MPVRKTNFDDLYKNIAPQESTAFSGIATVVDQVVAKTKRRYGTIQLDRLRPNPRQPRKVFDQEKLEELGNSIVENGLLEPLVVREASESGYFDLACGERRWRAMQLKGLAEAEAIILNRDCTDSDMEQIALIENLQREDLSPYETALAYHRLWKDEDGKPKRTIEEVAAVVHQSKSVVDDHLSILRVPENVRQLIIDDPSISLRIIRDLGNVESDDDRLYLIEQVRDGALSTSAVSKILQRVRKQQPPSARADRDISQSQQHDRRKVKTQESNTTTEDVQAISHALGGETEESAALKHRASSVVTLAVLEEKLRKDGTQIRRVIDKWVSEIQYMSVEEKAAVGNTLEQWQVWLKEVRDKAAGSVE